MRETQFCKNIRVMSLDDTLITVALKTNTVAIGEYEIRNLKGVIGEIDSIWKQWWRHFFFFFQLTDHQVSRILKYTVASHRSQ